MHNYPENKITNFQRLGVHDAYQPRFPQRPTAVNLLARSYLGHIVMLAQLGEVSVELLHPLFMGLEEFRPAGSRLGQLQ